MSATSGAAVITGAITDFGTSALVILTAIIGLGVAFLLVRYGWRKTKGIAH